MDSFKFIKNILKIFIIFLLFQILFYTLVFSQRNFYERRDKGDQSGEFKQLYLSPTRNKIDLNGTWQYSIDGSPLKSIYIPSTYDFADRVTFQRSFELSIDQVKNKCFDLVCYGINYQCEVYINNEFVGHHVGGYTTFTLKIPDNILNYETNNIIKIICDNEFNAKETIPLKQQIWGWKNFGGIFRDIYIIAKPAIYFDDVHIQPILNNDLSQATLKISYSLNTTDFKKLKSDTVLINQNRSNFDIYFQVFDKTNNSLVSSFQAGQIELEMNRNVRFQSEFVLFNPNLWSPNSPSIYLIKSFISKNGKIIDQNEQEFGIKKLIIKDGEFYLNNKQLILKGISRVEDYPNYGNAISYENLEKDILLIKNLGVNIILNKFTPTNPYLISLCDKYGIFICEEIPVWNTPSDILVGEKYMTTAENYLKEMVIRDRNHPSVFAWGIGSNFDSSDPKSVIYCEKMHNLLESLDNRFSYYSTSLVTNDKCFNTVDFPIANLNENDIKVFTSLLQVWKTKCKDKPIVVSMISAAIQPENHNGYGDQQSVEYQANYISQRYRILHQNKINNLFLSTFADYEGETPLLSVKNQNQYIYCVGLVNHLRDIRVSYNMLKALYNDEKIPTLIVGDQNQTYPLLYIIWGLILLILFAYVFNSYRRFRENIVRSFLRPYNFYADIRDQRIFSNIQTSIMAFIISGTFALVLSNIFYFYRRDTLFDYLLTHFISGGAFKEWLDVQIWNPSKFMLIFTLINLLLCLLVTLAIKIGAVIAKRKIFLTDSYAIVIWSALPSILMIPLGMVLTRVIENPIYIIPIFAFIFIEVIWILYRLLKGISIVYDVRMSRVYFSFILLSVFVFGILIIYLNYENSTIAYVKFVLNIFNNYSS